jgi:hypothetical protein
MGELNHTWQRHSGPASQTEPDPLCVERPLELDKSAPQGTKLTLFVREAARVFSCTIDRKKTQSLASEKDAFGGAGSEEKSPQKLQDDVDLGDEAFQIRTLAFGQAPGPSKRAKKGVLLAFRGGSWNAGSVRNAVNDLAQQLGRFSVAQSEYYFETDGSVPRDEWMWNMRWTARLKRFRLADDQEQEDEDKRREDLAGSTKDKVSQFGGLPETIDAEDACETLGGEQCDEAQSALFDFNNLVKH